MTAVTSTALCTPAISLSTATIVDATTITIPAVGIRHVDYNWPGFTIDQSVQWSMNAYSDSSSDSGALTGFAALNTVNRSFSGKQQQLFIATGTPTAPPALITDTRALAANRHFNTLITDAHGNTGTNDLGYNNTGSNNVGDNNSGNSNHGNNNSGMLNIGNSNTGNRNTGDSNKGDSNTGNSNTGNSNTGNCNSGNSNTGYNNSGDSNTGDFNSGSSNTGSYNSLTSNVGDYNTRVSLPDNINTAACPTKLAPLPATKAPAPAAAAAAQQHHTAAAVTFKTRACDAVYLNIVCKQVNGETPIAATVMTAFLHPRTNTAAAAAATSVGEAKSSKWDFMLQLQCLSVEATIVNIVGVAGVFGTTGLTTSAGDLSWTQTSGFPRL